MTMRDKSDKAKVLPIGFDHPNGPAKIFKSNSNPSLRLKASQVVGPLLRELCHDPKARKNSTRYTITSGANIGKKMIH